MTRSRLRLCHPPSRDSRRRGRRLGPTGRRKVLPNETGCGSPWLFSRLVRDNGHLESKVELDRNASLLCGRVVVVADGPGNFPRAVFVLPEMNELAFADALGFFMSRVVEAMDAHLDGAIALHVIHLQRTGNEFAGRFAANILPYAVG